MNFSSSVVLWIVHYTPRTRRLTPDMMLSRHFFYLLVLLLSVAIVCVATDAITDEERNAKIVARAAEIEASLNAQLAADNDEAQSEAASTASGENGGAAAAKSEGKNAASVSSVWMSVPLLIVVTLANVLVY
ncbi:uncharacterized protein TM35_000031790 [Trypanosoma theileri]|uniref:Uncharacterized protein n=1 Tax=Trypanosoma theileri TaxID=67003 RepID=A0A1X0P657_9TRYP|nr:uncharacterized protein TM35_000031790 [Trypanosoma theileri]ORC92426.1 hypothetical protein TM35_000031790 [Trypanosoma theileri]